MTTIADIEGSSGGPAGVVVLEDIFNSLNNLKEAQIFQVIEGTWDVTSVNLRLDRNFTAEGSAQTGDLNLSIRENSPTGTVLGTSAIERTGISLSEAWQAFSFSGVELSSGNVYCLVLECPHGFDDKPIGVGGVGDDFIQWFIDPGEGPYASGERHYYRDETGWVESSTQDNRAIVYGDDVSIPGQPTTPTPTNNSTEVDFSGFTLSWVTGGNTDTYNIYIGPSGGLIEKSHAQAATSYTTNIDEVPYNQKIYWRVDATKDDNTTEGTLWNFDARPAQVGSPSPANNYENMTLDWMGFGWSAAANATTYDVYAGTEVGPVPISNMALMVDDSELNSITQSYLLVAMNVVYPNTGMAVYNYSYYWRVDSKNEFGITEGSDWLFSTIAFNPPLPSGISLTDGDGGDGNEGSPTGTPTGLNNMMTVRRLVAAARNKIFYET